MPIRTTAELVAGIIEVDEEISLDPFITAASSLVDLLDSQVNVDSTEISSTQLELVERWLSAHFYAIRDPRTTMEKAGSVSESFESKVDLGLNITRYGQQAMLLDFSGWLKRRNTGVGRAKVAWLGTPADWQTTP